MHAPGHDFGTAGSTNKLVLTDEMLEIRSTAHTCSYIRIAAHLSSGNCDDPRASCMD